MHRIFQHYIKPAMWSYWVQKFIVQVDMSILQYVILLQSTLLPPLDWKQIQLKLHSSVPAFLLLSTFSNCKIQGGGFRHCKIRVYPWLARQSHIANLTNKTIWNAVSRKHIARNALLMEAYARGNRESNFFKASGWSSRALRSSATTSP